MSQIKNMMASENKENIVLFPLMAQGHVLPFLALAHQIQQRNYSITFVNTPFNIKRIKSSLPLNSSIRFLEIPFNSSDLGLPPNCENTDAIPFPLIVSLAPSSHSFKPAFRNIISKLVNELEEPPLCFISDMFFPWCAEIAHEFGSFHAIFSAGGGYGMAVYHTLWSNFPSMELTSDVFSLPGFPKSCQIHVKHISERLRTAKSDDSLTVFHKKLFDDWLDSDALLLNTIEEFDHVGLTYFRQKMNFPVFPIGPVLDLYNVTEYRGGKEPGIKWEICEKWLDSKPANSVLYISFGSQATISAKQMMQLAMALEASSKNFIWVVRPPYECDLNSEFNAEKCLPKGFEERIRSQNQGLLVPTWASQMKILSHNSISAFLSHCGWNSVLEALINGVPLMSWPIMAEQHFNAKMLAEEMGVCIEVAEGISCEVRHEEILEKIDLVTNTETGKGREMRRKACEIRDVIKNAMKNEEGYKGSSVKAMDEFLHDAALRREMISKLCVQKNGA